MVVGGSQSWRQTSLLGKVELTTLQLRAPVEEASLILPQFLQSYYKNFARDLARVVFLRNTTLLAINKKTTWQASFLERGARKLNNEITFKKQRRKIFLCIRRFRNFYIP